MDLKSDAGKARLTLTPTGIIYAIARIRKYGEDGAERWREVERERYRDAAYRHFIYYIKEPNGLDEESGLPHLWHLACNIAFLIEMEMDGRKTADASHPLGKWVDNGI